MIWIVGTGLMAKEYARVLLNLETRFIAIGRGEINCKNFEEEFNVETFRNGLKAFLDFNPAKPDGVIVAVSIESLSETTHLLLDYGINNILLEKPGVGSPQEVIDLSDSAETKNANVLIGYNRRFYASVLKAQEIIEEDGGLVSFNFEFTEWSHVICNLKKHKLEHNYWFLGNSTHVIDTAFFLGGLPKELTSFVKGGTDWHPSSSIFAGAGITRSGALFSYQANWEAPGRWVLELITKKSRLILKPFEKLFIQRIGSVSVEEIELDDSLDKNFKPGLYLQTKAFIMGEFSRFCKLEEQKYNIENYYVQMANYKYSNHISNSEDL